MEENKYYEQAVNCVKDTVLKEQRKLFEQCNRDMDVFYGDFSDSDMYFGGIIERGKVYELGYPKCTCHLVSEGKCKDGELCECSRQSILYILHELMPERKIRVEIIESILRGANQCRFRIYLD